MTPRLIANAALAAVLLGGSVLAADPLKSGPPVGADNDRSGFRPLFVAGPSTGQNLCPVWNNKYDLVALIFVREMSDPLTGLVKKIDQRVDAAAGKTARPVGAYIIFDSNSEGLDKRLRDQAEKETLKRVNFCIGTPPKNYDLAGEADVTVVIYTVGRRFEQKVTANFALRTSELTEAKVNAIVEALSEVLPPIVQTVVATSKEKEQLWSYTFDKPADGWVKTDFNDRPWKVGPGGFGTQGTPGAVVRTEWKTGEIWLRRAITLPEASFEKLHLRVHHDEDAEVYLNGVLAAKLTGFSTDYQEVPISENARKALRPGANVLAVSCKQTGGGQYIDVGLVELKR